MLTRVARFGAVGVFTAVVHYGLLYLGVEFLRLGAIIASSFGFVVAVIFNYLMHYSWTFVHDAPHGRTIGRYLVMIAVGFVVNGAVMYAGVDVLALNYLLVQVAALVVVVLWNFIVSSTWVFRS